MKTIAVSIDEPSLATIDRMARSGGTGPRQGRANRSALIRRAVQTFITEQRKREREESDRRILAAHHDEIERQARVLVAEQAEP